MKQHRVYNYVGAPLLFLGLTLPEVGAALIGFGGFLVFQSLVAKGMAAVGAAGFILVRRRMAKLYRGTALVSFLYWYAGISRFPKGAWVPSHKRTWWCQ